MTDVKPPTLWSVYHSLWGKATDAPFYDKSEWKDLFREADSRRDETKDSYVRRSILSLARLQGVDEREVEKYELR